MTEIKLSLFQRKHDRQIAFISLLEGNQKDLNWKRIKLTKNSSELVIVFNQVVYFYRVLMLILVHTWSVLELV